MRSVFPERPMGFTSIPFATLDTRFRPDKKLWAGRAVGAANGYATLEEAVSAARKLSKDDDLGAGNVLRYPAVVGYQAGDRFHLRQVDEYRLLTGYGQFHASDHNSRGVKITSPDVAFVCDDDVIHWSPQAKPLQVERGTVRKSWTPK